MTRNTMRPACDAGSVLDLLEVLRQRLETLSDEERTKLAGMLEGVERRSRPQALLPTWSVDPTRGCAEHWPRAWEILLPRWVVRAPASCVRHFRECNADVFLGTKTNLIALGLVADGDFPGDRGRNRSMVTYGRDGRAKVKGETTRAPALRVCALGGQRFKVEVYPPDDEVEQRRSDEGWLPQRLRAYIAPARPDSAGRATRHLQLVHSRT